MKLSELIRDLQAKAGERKDDPQVYVKSMHTSAHEGVEEVSALTESVIIKASAYRA